MELVKTMFKIENSDKAALARIAAEDGTSMSAIVRRLIRGEAKKRDLWPPVQKQEAIREHA